MVDRTIGGPSLPEVVSLACANGVDWVQLRERRLGGAAWLDWARTISAAAVSGARQAGRRVEILVNRRLDVALALGAEGLHLGFDAVSLADARRLLGQRALLGRSTHAVAEASLAASQGADYVHLAPVYPPLSKKSSRPALGTSAIAQAADQGTRVLAQGGVTVARTPELIARGASGIAVTGAILQAKDPAQITRDLRTALDRP